MGGSPSLLSLSVVGLFLTFCVMTDVTTRRIPNALTLSGMGTGLVLAGASHGLSGCAASAMGMLLAIALLIVPFALGGIGGGDVKMMARTALLTRSLDPLREPAQTHDTVALPYSVPLAFGTVLALAFGFTLGA